MSVRFNGNEPYTATTGLPGGTAWTVTFWARIAVDRNTYSSLFSIDNGSTTSPNVRCIQTESDGTGPYMWGGGASGISDNRQMVVGDWYRLALVKDGTTTRVYTAAATGAPTTASATLAEPATPTTLRLGAGPSTGEWFDGNLANIKLHGAALTQAEVEAEWASWDAVRTANLIRHHRFRDAASTADDSGNGNTLTASGTPTFEATNPPIGATHERTITDTVGVTDSVTRAQSHGRTVADPVGVADATLSAAAATRTITDSVAVTDSTTAGNAHSRTLADTVGISDAIAFTNGQPHERTITDTVGVTDGTSRSVDAARTVTDTVGIVDQVRPTLSKAPPNLSLWAVLPGDVLAPLPAFQKMELSRERNGVGSVAVDYPAAGAGFNHLRVAVTEDRPVEVEMWLGGSRTRPLRARLTQTSGDDLDGRAVWSFTGGFAEADLADGVVYPQPAPAERGELRFDNKNPGHIVLTVLQQAQARGALTGMGRDWTTTLDSSGQSWPSVVSGLKYSPKTTLLAILQDLADKDLAEFEVVIDDNGAKVLRLWAPDRRGTDRTTGAEPTLFRYGRISASPLRHSTRDTVTAILAIGADGLSATASDASAQARVGRRIEGTVDAGNIDNQAALTAYAQAALSALTKGQEEIRHPLTFGPGDPRPLAGYDLADRVLSERAGGARRGVDVQQWTLTANRQRVTDGEVVLNDLIASRLQRLARQVDRITSGGAVIGSSESPLIDDVTPPAAPTGLVVDSIAYQDAEHSQTLAAVTVGWSPVTTNAAGPATERAQAAAAILARILSGDPIGEDWTWTGAPPIVGVHNDPLLAAFEAAEPDATSTIGAEGQAWLDAYVATNSAGSSATNDVAGYKVQLAYLGLSQVGGLPSSNPVDEVIAYNEVTPSNGIPDTSYTFGGVEAGANIAVRVAAFDNSGNQSEWSTPIGHDTAVDNVPPEAPSAPVQRIWFRTLDTAWDGLDFAGAPMAADFDRVAVLMSQAATFDAPDPLGEPVLFDPLVTGVQHVANLYGAGTWNQPDLPVGVGWYSALVAVDRAGNVSAMSAITGPATAEQLVSQDLIDDIIDATKLGPDSVESQHVVNAAITSAKILDAAIVTAKIADLAVNNAKVETLDVGKLTAGTMTATVTNSGLFRTASSGNRVEFDSAGIRLYMGSTIVGRWQTSDASMLMTGTYQSALSGERINIFPDGTMRFYPVSGTNYSQLANFGNDLVMRGVMDGNSRSGRLNVNAQGAGMNFSAESEIPSDLRAEMAVFDRRARTTAPLISIVLDGKLSPADGTGRRVQFSQTNSSGVEITASRTFYTSRGVDGKGAFSGNGSGIVFDNGTLAVTTASTDTFGPITASAFNPPSSETVKDTIRDARADLDPLAVIRAARSKSWHYTWERWRNPIPTDEDPDPAPVPVEPPTRFGPIAEELPEVLQVEVPNPVGPGTTLGVSLGDQIGVLWGAIGQLMDQRVVHTSAAFPIPGGLVTANTDVDVTLPWDGGPTQSVPAVVSVVPVGPGPLQQRAITVTVREVTRTGVTVRFRSKRLLTGLSALDPDDRYVVNAIYSFIPPFNPGAAA